MDISSTGTQIPFDIEQFKKLYQRFDNKTLDELPLFYSPAIIFRDPIHHLNGISALTHYFSNFCNPETHCAFEFLNQISANDQAFLQWQMRYRHPQLSAGKALTLNGVTLIKFNEKIIYHEDFYDMGAMIYQHIPVVGWATKKINARLTQNNSGQIQ